MSWLEKTLAILASVLAVLAGIWLKAENTGSTKATQKAVEKDQNDAQKIKTNVERAVAKPVDDPVRVLREHGRLRD